jgi:sugar transferase EpsL
VSKGIKRLFDISGATIGLVLLAPVMIAVALAVLVTLGRPVLFTQRRPGLNGRLFTIRKFRTLRSAHDAGGRALPDAERMTSLGRLLRSTSVDELPELWNVLVGDMSLVGPRPLLPEYLSLYSARQARRHEVRPGITGWAQVNGRNALCWEQRLEMDVWYVDNRSTLLDLRILALTVVRVMARDGIVQPGHATMEQFRGSNSVPSKSGIAGISAHSPKGVQ